MLVLVRRLLISCLPLALSVALVLAFQAQAQSPTAPGAGHGFLIDKHLAGGNCAACHTESPPSAAVPTSVCISCHGSYKEIAAKSAADEPNPHASHLGELPCEACHHVHRTSEIYCDQCHAFGMTAP